MSFEKVHAEPAEICIQLCIQHNNILFSRSYLTFGQEPSTPVESSAEEIKSESAKIQNLIKERPKSA